MNGDTVNKWNVAASVREHETSAIAMEERIKELEHENRAVRMERSSRLCNDSLISVLAFSHDFGEEV